ncbi:hypothetical protein LTR99_003178 [Exophiala xenobiotica]|uniref:Uncharacterized protein n=1 Tax=Vermiconidia calcicola TaxID=1690605 RepID=A0AAV9QCH3_9PEZI|nr:hypothetical protein LTR96_006791 [Exophiala xenobiotica]KAK5535496.1 hypothetical protein LTR23_008376 [Chaetothyriales sp. CCFEE 6169]KAK5538844.1 hypothetical protein LTR25_004388 [Vermiconidia calcicola]KAK5305634.1 hypothetical protein LTR99_003178 [Exophiala xenobiotica]KAK5335979.1 hypothetical protein LTR98_008195 [Exophiala xenobiotica]
MTTDWGYPEELWQSYCWDSNGYAGSASHIHQDGIKVIKTSWSKFLVKQLDSDSLHPSKSDEWYGYQWYEMCFYVYAVSDGATVVFCINTPPIFRDNLIRALEANKCGLPTDASAFFQATILAEVVKLYDTSIWTLRNHVRQLEKV